MRHLVFLATDKNAIILDFFSGSATTAHAVMQLNTENDRNRKFIRVQLPEVCDEKSEAYKAGYKNICEIGKERIRCVGELGDDEYVKFLKTIEPHKTHAGYFSIDKKSGRSINSELKRGFTSSDD